MAKIIYSDRLEFNGEVLPVHLVSDRQIYVQVDDLCNFIGLEPNRVAEDIQADVSTAELLLFMTAPGDDTPLTAEPSKAAYLNLAALPYWLGKVSHNAISRPDRYDQLVRYTFEFLDTTWMFYRAAVRDLEQAGISRTKIAGRGHRKRLPGTRPSYSR